jgi:hypothetical protein
MVFLFASASDKGNRQPGSHWAQKIFLTATVFAQIQDQVRFDFA